MNRYAQPIQIQHPDRPTSTNQLVQAHTPNGTPVAVHYDELSIAERASLIPEPWEYATQRRIGGNGINYTSVRVYNGPYKSGNTRNGAGGGSFALIVLLIVAGFVIFSALHHLG